VTAPDVGSIARQFDLRGDIESIAPLPGGHINDSYQVTVRGAGGGPGEPTRYLLQRLNTLVFPRPDHVMENVSHVTRHLAVRLANEDHPDWRRRTLVLVPTRDGADWLVSPDGGYWRSFPFIEGVVTLEHVRGPDAARSAGLAFGEFLRLISDYAGPPLHDVLPGFHDPVAHYERLEAAVRRDAARRAAGARPEIIALMSVRGLVEQLPPRVAAGELPRRIVHNDAKLANVLLDAVTGAPLCVVDLDTVMPGLVLYDFGDLVRSATSPTAEDDEDLSRVGVRRPLFEALAQGFLDAVGGTLRTTERALLVYGAQLIILEQAIRFLTDYLEGDRYYRITRPEHNLIRCRAQFKLFTTVTEARAELESLLAAAGSHTVEGGSPISERTS